MSTNIRYKHTIWLHILTYVIISCLLWSPLYVFADNNNNNNNNKDKDKDKDKDSKPSARREWRQLGTDAQQESYEKHSKAIADMSRDKKHELVQRLSTQDEVLHVSLVKALNDEGLEQFYALRARAQQLRDNGEYQVSSRLFKAALDLYTGALAAPYAKYTSYANYGQDTFRYARMNAQDRQATFHDLELQRTQQVHAALQQFKRTLSSPHRSDL
jgi:hypothetical protein